MKQVTLPDFLTPAEIETCRRMYEESTSSYAQRVKTEIIEPNMTRINKQLGECDASYLAYAVEYVMMKAAEQI